MKNKLILSVVALVMIASLAACAAPAATGANPYPRTLVGTGTGKVYLTPDVAYINIGVRSEAGSVQAALDDNTGKAQSIKDALVALGVEEKDIQTAAFNIYPQQQYDPQTGEIKGTFYVVENTVYVTVRNLGKLGGILDAVTRKGANTINGISFDVLDKEAAIKQARDEAIAKAKTNAQELAAAAGISLGDLITLNVYVGSPVIPMFDSKNFGGAGRDTAVPISAGQLVISVDASITYEIR